MPILHPPNQSRPWSKRCASDLPLATSTFSKFPWSCPHCDLMPTGKGFLGAPDAKGCCCGDVRHGFVQTCFGTFGPRGFVSSSGHGLVLDFPGVGDASISSSFRVSEPKIWPLRSMDPSVTTLSCGLFAGGTGSGQGYTKAITRVTTSTCASMICRWQGRGRWPLQPYSSTSSRCPPR